jgi:hypothetical protein
MLTEITLPNEDQMLERLLEVDKSKALREQVFTKLLVQAGKPTRVGQVVVLLHRVFIEYARKDARITLVQLDWLISKCIGALIVDKSAATEARNFFEEARVA